MYEVNCKVAEEQYVCACCGFPIEVGDTFTEEVFDSECDGVSPRRMHAKCMDYVTEYNKEMHERALQEYDEEDLGNIVCYTFEEVRDYVRENNCSDCDRYNNGCGGFGIDYCNPDAKQEGV